MTRNKYNINFLPKDFQNYILRQIQSEGIFFRISSPRKSKLGDYRYNKIRNTHSISVNIDLSEIHFLITFIHELAHKKCHELHLGRVASHGKEWKQIFVELLEEAKEELKLKSTWEEEIMRNINSPRATFTGFNLDDTDALSVSDLSLYSKFELKNGRKFQLIKKRRTRYLCSDLVNEQLYSVSGKAIVQKVL
ncbi:MAG: hypothetical protein CMP67_08615 [Flavobacteriales bacterium]|nr:hypothetical protein [Flavobacteriales bacterium]